MTVVNRPKYTCRYPGCNAITNSNEKGYCPKHRKPDLRTQLNLRRAPGSAEFYGGWSWKKTRAAYKKLNPICEPCKRNGLTVEGHTVHHTTERPELEAAGISPYDFDYLEHVCFKCHQKELQKRRRNIRY